MKFAFPTSGPTRISALTLILSNLGIAGFAATGFASIGDIFLLYWAESAVILAFSLLSVIRTAKAASLFLVPFFLFHAGIFMMVHLVFITTLFVAPGAFGFPDPLATIGQLLDRLFLPLAALVASHGVSWIVHQRAGADQNPGGAMAGFYGRIVVMQVAIIFGGMAVMALGTPTWALVILIVAKTILDLGAHLVKHKPKGLPKGAVAMPGGASGPNPLEGGTSSAARGPLSPGPSRPRLRR